MPKSFSQFRMAMSESAMHKLERCLPKSAPGRTQNLAARVRSTAAFLALIFALLCVPSLRAQTTASLTGAVTDPTGAVVPGA